MRSSRMSRNSAAIIENPTVNKMINDSMDSSYFHDLSNLMRDANDSSFLLHVDDEKFDKDKSSKVIDISKNTVDWDAVDSGLCKKPAEKFESFTGIPRHTKRDPSIDESQFVSLNADEARRLFDKDGDDRLRLNTSTAASFSIPNDVDNKLESLTSDNGDETMGRYFYKKSSFPAETKENLECKESLSQFNAPLPSTSTALSSFTATLHEEPGSDYWSNINLPLQAGEERILSGGPRENVVIEHFPDRRPSIARFSSFFRSSQSDGLDKDDIINHVLKYCKTQKSELEPTFEQHRDADNLEDTFSQSLEPNMSGIVRTSQYTLNHSTPIKKIAQNLSDFSLKTMCGTATSLDRDILPRLSQLPHEISRSVSKSMKNNSRSDSVRRYTQSSTSQAIKVRSGSKQRHTDSVAESVISRPETSRQFPNSITESAISRGDNTERSLATPTTLKHSVSINTSHQSATSTCSTSCSTQTMQNQHVPQGPFPMYGYPIIVQVQCPHHQVPPQNGHCNNIQHSCNSSQTASQFQPWMPMMPMTYPQFPHSQLPMQQPVQNCTNCQCSSSTASTVGLSVNTDQTLAIDLSRKTLAKEIEEIEFAPPSRGLPKIHFDKPIIRWGPTEVHVGEYTSVTIVNQSDSALFLRCGVIQNSESKHFKIVSETYDRKIQSISLECEIAVADIKTISLVFTPEKEKRYLGELHIKCRYLDHNQHDGIYSCKLPLVGTGVKSSHR